MFIFPKKLRANVNGNLHKLKPKKFLIRNIDNENAACIRIE